MKRRSKNDERKFLEITGKTKNRCWKRTDDWKNNKYGLIVQKIEQDKKYEDLEEKYGH